MFRFAHPQYLWLLLAVPALIALYWAAARNRRKRLARFGNPTLLRGLMPEVSTGRVRLKSILFTAAVALLVLALARPQWGSKLREETSEGIEMMLVVDVSNSMLAEDFAPNRLERTKYAIDRLFDGLRQDRVGLVVFAGEPKVQLPITSDYRMAKAFARKIDPSLVAVQGTAVGKALSQALMSFSSETEQNHSRVIVLITDGENHEDDAVAVAERAKELGIRIFTIGIGTPEGAPIRIGGEFIRDEKGDMVVSKLDEQMLQQIADITGGAYVRSSNQSVGLDEIVQSINRMEATELSTVKFEEYNEQYQYLVGLALFLLLAEFFLLDRRNPLLARFNIFREERPEEPHLASAPPAVGADCRFRETGLFSLPRSTPAQPPDAGSERAAAMPRRSSRPLRMRRMRIVRRPALRRPSARRRRNISGGRSFLGRNFPDSTRNSYLCLASPPCRCPTVGERKVRATQSTAQANGLISVRV